MREEKSLDEMSAEELVEKAILQKIENRNKMFRLINILIGGAVIGGMVYFLLIK